MANKMRALQTMLLFGCAVFSADSDSAIAPKMKFDRVLKVAVDHWSPHVYVTIHDNGTIEATGPAAKMLDVIAKSLGFQYQFIESPDRAWGAVDANGTWHGMVGMVHRKEADMAVGPFGVTESRSKVIKYSYPLLIDSCRILTKRKTPVADPWSFLKPYGYFVWIGVFANFLFMGITLSFTYGRSIRLRKKVGNASGIMAAIRSTSLKTTENALWDMYSSFFQQSIQWTTSEPISNLLMGMWLLLSLVLVRSYGSALTSQLAVRTVPIDINSLQDIVYKSDLEMIFELHSALSEYITKAKTGIYADLGAEESRISRRKYHMLSASLETDVMPETGALLAQEMTEKIFTADAFSAKGSCDFLLSKESFWHLMFAFIGQRDSPLMDMFTEKILYLTEFDIYGQFLREQLFNYTYCARAPTKFTITEQHSFEAVWGMFVVFAFGLALSMIAFCAELIIGHKKE